MRTGHVQVGCTREREKDREREREEMFLYDSRPPVIDALTCARELLASLVE